MIDRLSLKLLHPDGSQTMGLVSAGITDPDAHRCRLEFDHPSLGRFAFTEFDFFRCLKQLRLVLEPHGIRLLCNGARINAFVSGMAGQMGYGLKVYLLVPGQPAGDTASMVSLFDEAPADAVATVEAQVAFEEAFWQPAVAGKSA